MRHQYLLTRIVKFNESRQTLPGWRGPAAVDNVWGFQARGHVIQIIIFTIIMETHLFRIGPRGPGYVWPEIWIAIQSSRIEFRFEFPLLNIPEA